MLEVISNLLPDPVMGAFGNFFAILQSLPQNILFDIGLVLIFAAAAAYFAKAIRQPLIPAYIIAGIILGPLGLSMIHDTEIIHVIAEIGIIFLLFIVGIEMDLNKLKSVGWTSVIVGSLQVVLTFIAGYFIALQFLGFDSVNAVYAGLVLAFSSTMIVIKLLSDEEELNTLHGRIIIGILFLQDIFVIFALAILMGTSTFSFGLIIPILIKAFTLFLIAYLLNRFVVYRLFKFAAKSQELLFLLSLAICFIFVMISYLFGFSIAIGAFIAGITIANLPYNLDIIGRVSPLKDFFATIFFVALGLQLGIGNFAAVVKPLLIFMILILLLKPIVIFLLLSVMGYDKRNSFASAVSLAQISEFSLILVMSLANVSEVLFTTTILAAIISIALTSYIIKYEMEMYNLLSPILTIFEKLAIKRRRIRTTKKDKKNIVLFGYHRIGTIFYKALTRMKKKVLVVDFDPDSIELLQKQKIPAMYGDVANKEVLKDISFKHMKVVISSVPKVKDNLVLLAHLKDVKCKAVSFIVAGHMEEALTLYDHGADYVILPHLMSGETVSMILEKYIDDKKALLKIKREHLKHLLEINAEKKY
jgi:Kef-type K+ transport system membrane component KefB